jgi:hypothetical protein
MFNLLLAILTNPSSQGVVCCYRRAWEIAIDVITVEIPCLACQVCCGFHHASLLSYADTRVKLTYMPVRVCAGTLNVELGLVFWWLSFKHGRVGISRYLSCEDAVVIHQKQLPHPSLPLSNNARQPIANRSLQLLLGAELVGVTALLLAAVGGTGRETSLG